MNRMRSTNRGILAIIGSSSAIFWPGALVFGFPGVMGPYWQKIFRVGQGAIGNTLFFNLTGVGIFMFFVGHWQERFGIKKMVALGGILCSLNLLILIYGSKLYFLYIWAFLNGTASCFIYIPALTAVQLWYPERRGLVSGFVNLMFGLSAAIMSPVFTHMLESMGYVSMNILVAIIAFAVGLISAQIIEVPERTPLSQQTPCKIQARPVAKASESLTVKESLRTSSFWFLWLTWALQGAAGIAMVTLSTAFGLSKGYTMETSVIILTSFNITNGFGRVVMGFLSDIAGRNLTMSITFFAGGCAYFVLPHVNTLTVSAILAAIIGLALGTLFAVSAALATDCFGLKHFGSIFGLCFTAYGFVSGVLGPSLSGYLLDITHGNFVIVFSYLGIFCVVSGILIRFVVPRSSK